MPLRETDPNGGMPAMEPPGPRIFPLTGGVFTFCDHVDRCGRVQVVAADQRKREALVARAAAVGEESPVRPKTSATSFGEFSFHGADFDCEGFFVDLSLMTAVRPRSSAAPMPSATCFTVATRVGSPDTRQVL